MVNYSLFFAAAKRVMKPIDMNKLNEMFEKNWNKYFVNFVTNFVILFIYWPTEFSMITRHQKYSTLGNYLDDKIKGSSVSVPIIRKSTQALFFNVSTENLTKNE